MTGTKLGIEDDTETLAKAPVHPQFPLQLVSKGDRPGLEQAITPPVIPMAVADEEVVMEGPADVGQASVLKCALVA